MWVYGSTFFGGVGTLFCVWIFWGMGALFLFVFLPPPPPPPWWVLMHLGRGRSLWSSRCPGARDLFRATWKPFGRIPWLLGICRGITASKPLGAKWISNFQARHAQMFPFQRQPSSRALSHRFCLSWEGSPTKIGYRKQKSGTNFFQALYWT